MAEEFEIVHGSRLEAARKVAGLSLTRVGEQLRINPQKLMQMEQSNGVKMNYDTIDKFAETYGRHASFFFEQPLMKVFPVTKRAERLTPEQFEAVAATVSIQVEQQLEIESYFHPGELVYRGYPSGFPIHASTPAEAADAADHFRVALVMPKIAPIPSVTLMVERSGFRVATVYFPYPVFDALAFISDDEYRLPIIAMQAGIPRFQQRWAIVRELAHYLLVEPDNALANHFAGSFLFPDETIFEALGQKRVDFELSELVRVSSLFGVSLRNLITRMATLQVVDRETYQLLIQLIEDLDWDRNPPNPLPFEPPVMAIHHATRLHAEDRISTEMAMALLEVSYDEWMKLIGRV